MTDTPRSQSPAGEAREELRAALLSVGADKETISKMFASARLGNAVVPLHARGAVTDEVNDLWLLKLPEFLRWFEKEFPDGTLGWDPAFEDTTTGKSHPVIRVKFNYQEGDQGDHWSYRPTTLEEESYHKKLDELRLRDGEKVDIRAIISER